MRRHEGGSNVTASCSAPRQHGWCSGNATTQFSGGGGQFSSTRTDNGGRLRVRHGNAHTCLPWTADRIWNHPRRHDLWKTRVRYGTAIPVTLHGNGLTSVPPVWVAKATRALYSTALQPGGCGSAPANPATSNSIPPSNLCNSTSTVAQLPTFDPVTSQWVWSCKGTNGTATSCSDIYDPTPPVCGLDTQVVDTGPPLLTIYVRPARPGPAVTAGANWAWSCTSAMGTQIWCKDAGLGVNGQCGSANGVSSPSIPTALCAAGDPSAVTTNLGDTIWEWTCSGSTGVTASNCSAPVGSSGSSLVCGTDNGVPSVSSPAVLGLCIAGAAPSSVTSIANVLWTWTCSGSSYISNCNAAMIPPPVPGACGSANGTADWQAPNVNLCVAGDPSTVSGNYSDPWTWSCLGTTTANCAANYARSAAE